MLVGPSGTTGIRGNLNPTLSFLIIKAFAYQRLVSFTNVDQIIRAQDLHGLELFHGFPGRGFSKTEH